MKSAEELCMEYLANKPSYYGPECQQSFVAGYNSRDPEIAIFKKALQIAIAQRDSSIQLYWDNQKMETSVVNDCAKTEIDNDNAEINKLLLTGDTNEKTTIDGSTDTNTISL